MFPHYDPLGQINLRMRNFFQNTVTVLALPFLAVVAFAFEGVRAALRFAFALVGWKLAWPPVLVDDLEAETSNPVKPRTRATRRGRRCGSR